MNKTEFRRKTTRLLLIGGASLLLTAAVGLVDGHLTHRWSNSARLAAASAAVDELPESIGNWESQELEMSSRNLAVAGATGATKRLYRNRQTGETILVMLLCGPHGPISLHPPTVCLTGAGWTPAAQAETVTYSPQPDLTASAWRTGFHKREDYLDKRIVADWCWNDGTGWKASDNPRYEFAGSPYLFKLYVISDRGLMQDDAGMRRSSFVEALLLELDQNVFESISLIDNQDGGAEL